MADTKKVVINNCFGGFGLSAQGVKRLAELQGRECYFYANHAPLDIRVYAPVSIEAAEEAFIFFAFDVPNAHETHLGQSRNEEWHDLTQEERQARSADYRAHQIDVSDLSRDDANLVRVVEELGPLANARFSQLKVVEIPADVEFTISEYDGNEHIAEKHRTWG